MWEGSEMAFCVEANAECETESCPLQRGLLEDDTGMNCVRERERERGRGFASSTIKNGRKK